MDKVALFSGGIFATSILVMFVILISQNMEESEDRAVLDVMNLSCERIDDIEYKDNIYRLASCNGKNRIVKLYK